MKKILIIQEFAKILKVYMKTFSLEAVDIAYLAKSTKRTISSIINNVGSLQLETAEAIAKSFGVRYYEFGNPNHPVPSSESLPDKTRQRIEYRKKVGPSVEITYKSSDINLRINEILGNFNTGHEFLAEEIATSIQSSHGEIYAVSEIIDRFKKTFKDYIEKTQRKEMSRKGRGPKPVFYRIIRQIK